MTLESSANNIGSDREFILGEGFIYIYIYIYIFIFIYLFIMNNRGTRIDPSCLHVPVS